MKKRVLILVVLVATVAPALRAQEDLSKQLEVTRAYTPRVGRAEKLPFAPDMTDTVRLRPRISYRITSTASSTSFATRPFDAATVSEVPSGGSKPLYIRAGLGAPFETDFDLYYTPRVRAGRVWGLFANHDGSFSKITNDLGHRVDATQMSNVAGVWSGRQWRRYSLEFDATYDMRVYDPYGVASTDHQFSRSIVYDRVMNRFALGLARAGLSFGDNFTDLDRFNFRTAIDGGYAHGNDQFVLDTRVTMAQMPGGGSHGFEVVLAEDGAFGTRSSSGMSSFTLTLAPRYLFVSGDFSLRVGVDVRYLDNKFSGQDRFGIAPSLEARLNLAGGAFVPFAAYTSRILDGDRESLSRRNPYVVSGGSTAWIDDARVGFSGDLGDVFSYKLSGGVSFFSDYQLFVGTRLVTLRDASTLSYPPMWFAPLAVNGARLTFGGQMALHNLGGFGARVYADWNKYDFHGDYAHPPVGDLPRYDAGVEFSYRYKRLFSFRVGAEVIGRRDYLVRASSSSSLGERYTAGVIDPVMDVTVGAEVRVVRDMWVFVDGENLANQVLYPYPHYRGLGTSVTGGIKIVF